MMVMRYFLEGVKEKVEKWINWVQEIQLKEDAMSIRERSRKYVKSATVIEQLVIH